MEWDPSAFLRAILKITPLVGNTGFTPREANDWSSRTLMDAVVIVRPLLENADYVAKCEQGLEDSLYQEQPGDEFWWYKSRNNDKRDGHLNWPGRAIKPLSPGTATNRLATIHD